MNEYKKKGGFRKREFTPRSNFGATKNFEMFKAECTSCHKTCEVPFRPNGKKAVYCRDCFAANGGGEERSGARDSYNSAYKSNFKPEKRQDATGGMKGLEKQLELLNSKLDALIQVMQDK